MAFVPKNLAGCNYPIQTDIQKKFWGSRHKCNRAKAIIAFSYDKDNAMRNLRRIMGWTHFWRHRAWNAFGHFVNTPSMEGIPFSTGSEAYWECMPNDTSDGNITPPPDGFECHDLVAADITATVVGFNASNGSITPSEILGIEALALEVNSSSGFIRFTYQGGVTPYDAVVVRYDGIEYQLPKAGNNYQLSNATQTQELYDAMSLNVGVASEVCFLSVIPAGALTDNSGDLLTDNDGNTLTENL